MKFFDDYSSFVQFVESDSKKSDINPVRFVNVETMQMWVKVKSYFTNHAKLIIKLSDFCENDDIAPNLNRLKVKLGQVLDTTLLVPISEYLRINRPIASKTLTDILYLSYRNNDGKLRLYVLLYRMKDILATIQIGPREINTIAVIRENLDSDYSLTIVQKSLDFSIKGNEIDGFKKYLIYWEQNPDKPIVLRTKNAINYQDIVFSDNVEVIVSAYKLLRYLGLSGFAEEYGTEDQWGYLVTEYCKTNNLDTAVGTILQALKYDDKLFSKWNNYTPNKKWLLLLWAMLHTENKYLKILFNDSTSVSNFEDLIYSSILPLISTNNFWELYSGRKLIISYMNLPVSEYTLRYCYEEKGIDKLKCLTDCSAKEREMIISTLSEVSNWKDAIAVIEKIYPLLGAYLKTIDTGNPSIDMYFEMYRRNKINNTVSDDFLVVVNKFAEEQGKSIWQFHSRNAIIEQTYSVDDTILFVDALGAEYTEAFKCYFDENSYNVEINYGYCNMPSTTSNNNDFYKTKNYLTPIYDLDEWKHSKCIYPQSIETELSLLKKVKESVDNGLTTYKRVIVVADHGTSRLAVIAKGNSFDTSDNAVKYKYGRYCVDDSQNYNYFGCIHHDTYWIFANYDRFTQKGSPVCEIHGGASIEEMIVPIIVVSRKTTIESPISKKISVILLTPTIKLPIDKNVKVMFRLEGNPQKVQVRVNNQYITCESEKGIYFFIHNITSNESLYNARVLIDGKIAGDIQYRIIRPMEEKKGFDI